MQFRFPAENGRNSYGSPFSRSLTSQRVGSNLWGFVKILWCFCKVVPRVKEVFYDSNLDPGALLDPVVSKLMVFLSSSKEDTSSRPNKAQGFLNYVRENVKLLNRFLVYVSV
jgi:hypothetical protein